MENKKQYCVHCGAENKLEDKKCCKCKKTIKPKSNLLEYIKGTAKDKVEDNIISAIKDYIKAHLYGTVLVCSIIVTVTSAVIVNTEDNYIQKVTEKPSLASTNTYTGEGLSYNEIVKKYTEAIRLKDYDTAQNLWLENYYPEIKEEIIQYAKDNNLINIYDKPITNHDLYANGAIYFGDWNDDYFIFDREELIEKGSFGKYNYVSINFQTTYTTDEEDVGKYIEFVDGVTRISLGQYITDSIELIEVDGNYYVLGEDLYWENSYGERLARRDILTQNGGDLSNATT